MSFAGYSFCKGHSCSYIRVAQHSCYLRAHYPAEFMAAVLANGGGFYHPFAYVAEAMRMGLTVLPPDVNASRFRTSGKGREVRIGFQFIKGLSAEAVERMSGAGWRPCRQPEEARDPGHEGSVAVPRDVRLPSISATSAPAPLRPTTSACWSRSARWTRSPAA